MSYERLAAVDAAFLHIESDHEPQHVGSLALLEGAPLRDPSGRIRIDDLRALVQRRLHRVARMRQKVVFVPLSLGLPVWVDDDHFDLEHHVRLTALPRPGGEAELRELFGRVQSLPLDRARPLWELWVVDGMADDQVALITKCHHAMGDGIANIDLVAAFVDVEAQPPPDPTPPRFVPRAAPRATTLVRDSLVAQAVRPAQIATGALDAVRKPAETARTARSAVRALAQFASRTSPAPWNVTVTPHRRWARADVSLHAVADIRRRTGATINDVVLELCTAALRDELLTRDEPVIGRTLKAMVPVSRRSDDEHGSTLGNKVSLIVADLPVGVDDPLERLRMIHDQTTSLKASGLADGVELWVRVAGEVPVIAAPMARVLSTSVPMNVVITNIPGPPVPLYVLGARVLHAYPYVEVIDGEGLTIAVISYEGDLSFGITADRDAMRNLDRLADGIEAAARRLHDDAGDAKSE